MLIISLRFQFFLKKKNQFWDGIFVIFHCKFEMKSKFYSKIIIICVFITEIFFFIIFVPNMFRTDILHFLDRIFYSNITLFLFPVIVPWKETLKYSFQIKKFLVLEKIYIYPVYTSLKRKWVPLDQRQLMIVMDHIN